jgi:hypothetical protein
MRTNLFEFLFGESAVYETKGADLGEQIVKLFEEADEAEGVEMVANKKPLATALKALGIDEPVEACSQWCEIRCDDDAKYHEYCRLLGDPDAMHKLAEMGWVLVRCGDEAMSNEKPSYKLGFIEIETAETEDGDKPEDAEKLRKDSQKDASTEFKRDDKMNPVELDDPGKGKKDAGVGDPKDGEDPEGKPKGSEKKVKESSAKGIVNRMLDEMTTAGNIPAFPADGNALIRPPFNRRRKPPVKKPYDGSPKNS